MCTCNMSVHLSFAILNLLIHYRLTDRVSHQNVPGSLSQITYLCRRDVKHRTINRQIIVFSKSIFSLHFCSFLL